MIMLYGLAVPQAVALKTVNGGTTWRVLTPTLATATNYTIDAFDTTTAWVTGTVGGSADVSIWKTTNGGTTWVSQYNNPPGFGNGVRFFNPNDGVYITAIPIHGHPVIGKFLRQITVEQIGIEFREQIFQQLIVLMKNWVLQILLMYSEIMFGLILTIM